MLHLTELVGRAAFVLKPNSVAPATCTDDGLNDHPSELEHEVDTEKVLVRQQRPPRSFLFHIYSKGKYMRMSASHVPPMTTSIPMAVERVSRSCPATRTPRLTLWHDFHTSRGLVRSCVLITGHTN